MEKERGEIGYGDRGEWRERESGGSEREGVERKWWGVESGGGAGWRWRERERKRERERYGEGKGREKNEDKLN